ncbi:MAG: hypothetical protein KAJ93_07385, partial [Methanosarcinales archaeon]|nr:hypothetical protein [Methanosarcinales archaeon]
MEKNLELLKSNHKSTTVYCLCIDMIGSTKIGLGFTNIMNDCFNISVVRQIEPHLKRYELTDALIKFTGDGWLVMTNKTEKVQSLCNLAITMASKFREDIHELSEIDKKLIPSLRLAICCGRDIPVKLLDGSKDWVGDSARRATRASGYCMRNEIIIDEPVRYEIHRDFSIKSLNPEERFPEFHPKRMEEKFKLYILKGQDDIFQKWNELIDSCTDYSEALGIYGVNLASF